MKKVSVFKPVRRAGLVFQAVGAILLSGLASLGVWQAGHTNLGPIFLFSLAPVLLALVLVPLLVYRAYALHYAIYELERDGIRLHWGLRAEDIPMDEVLWVRLDSQVKEKLLLPWLHWPGSVLGVRRMGGMGEVEFLASRTNGLILIATTRRVFAVSPEDPKVFLGAFQRLAELGSLTPIPARSIYPSFLLARVWSDRPARFLLLASLTLSLLLLARVSLAVPNHTQVVLGFDSAGAARDLVPSIRLLLLPVLNAFFFLVDLLAGLYFYRNQANRYLAYLVWIGGVFTPLLFLLAVHFILQLASLPAAA